jgi:hypothetical protein
MGSKPPELTPSTSKALSVGWISFGSVLMAMQPSAAARLMSTYTWHISVSSSMSRMPSPESSSSRSSEWSEVGKSSMRSEPAAAAGGTSDDRSSPADMSATATWKGIAGPGLV